LIALAAGCASISTPPVADFPNDPASRQYIWFTENSQGNRGMGHTSFEFLTNSHPRLAIQVLWTEESDDTLITYTNVSTVPSENWTYVGPHERGTRGIWRRRILKTRFNP
jgi:hypothetical protein